jgi:hypothetical protein
MVNYLKKLVNILIICFCLHLLFGYAVFAYGPDVLYKKAENNARGDNLYVSFMQLRMILREYPNSKYSKSALFSIGEFYFLTNNYQRAADNLQLFIKKYPDSELNIFALSFLYKIAKETDSNDLSQALKKRIITFHQHSFIFREHKSYSYRSVLLNKYLVKYSIDKVEFFINEEPFVKIEF